MICLVSYSPVFHVSVQIEVFLCLVVPDWPRRVAKVGCCHRGWGRISVNYNYNVHISPMKYLSAPLKCQIV